jgi:hypothetical protein
MFSDDIIFFYIVFYFKNYLKKYGGSLAWTGWGIFVRYVSRNQKFYNLSKTVLFVEIFFSLNTIFQCILQRLFENKFNK